MGLPIKFGVSTWLWTSPFTTETTTLFPNIKEMGYDVVEIPIEDPGLFDVKKVKAALEANELKATICGSFGPGRDLTHDDPDYRQAGLTYIESCLRIGQHLGTGFFAGPMYSAVGKARLVSPEKKDREWGRAVANLRMVCKMAEKRGLEIAIEPLNRFESDLVNTAEDVMRLITDINHPAAKVLLDGFHMNIEEPDIEKAIRLAGNKLIHVQVSENYRGTPGTGQTRWDIYYNALKAIHYQGVVSIESFAPGISELADAVCMWRPAASSQDRFAIDGLRFLKKWARGQE
jgi:D-psicose/D-tagatose/L-ribulose 3-epimerase